MAVVDYDCDPVPVTAELRCFKCLFSISRDFKKYQMRYTFHLLCTFLSRLGRIANVASVTDRQENSIVASCLHLHKETEPVFICTGNPIAKGH